MNATSCPDGVEQAGVAVSIPERIERPPFGRRHARWLAIAFVLPVPIVESQPSAAQAGLDISTRRNPREGIAS